MNPDTAKIDAVVFDVGRVLIQWDMRHLIARLTDDPAEVDYVFEHVVTEQWHFQHDAGRDLQEMLAERKAQFPGYERFLDAYATRFNETVPGPVAGTHALVERLDARGVPLFCITNFADSFWDDFVPEWPVLAHFRDVIVSGKEKLAKPDPAIFRLAEDRFGHPGEAMLFIDDNPANIAAAAALGWQVHLFTDAARLEADLAARGLV
ncbi:MAG: HAD family phosphatase [Sphingomonadales bacterium]|nr:HAD family phosphatase [Sphingomonadales bacterium]MBD3775070.1 HAD family phosphatase [Paracoccaceae bacterium]